jgi:hypothetical protein
MRRTTRWVALVAVIVVVCPGGRLLAQSDGEHDKEKRPSGRSFTKETRIDAVTSSSLAAAGWDSERAWSGYDDWEPAIAADPSSSYVYQMATRYNGPTACKGCPFPIVVFRASSDGGATWGPDKPINISKNKQNDPEIEVASDGTIYVLWLDQ